MRFGDSIMLRYNEDQSGNSPVGGQNAPFGAFFAI
jgi:hypothetical protein